MCGRERTDPLNRMDIRLDSTRNHILAVLRHLRRYRVVAIQGGRQVGKSTLAREVADRFEGPTRLYPLDKVAARQRLIVPESELAHSEGLVILDEVQRLPRLFLSLPKILEASGDRARYLLIGGTPTNLLTPSLEHLINEIAIYELPGLSLHEVGSEHFQRLWLRGGLPRSFTANSTGESFACRAQHTLDIIEADPQRPGPPIAAGPMRSFLLSLGQYHGKVLDIVELARSFGVRSSTVQRYLDALRESFVIRLLQPVRSGRMAGELVLPKVFFSDTGVLHNLTGLATSADLEASPKAALSWKGYAMESAIRRIRAGAGECSHWSLQGGQGLDLLVTRNDFRWGFEFQYLERPRFTASMKLAMQELKLNRLDVIHRSEGPGKLEGGIQVHTLDSLPESLRLPPGFERRPEFLEMEPEPVPAGD